MRIGMMGLGRMGMNMARRLMRNGLEVAAWNRTPSRTEELASQGGLPAATVEQLTELLEPPRVVWIMLPAGEPVEEAVDRLGGLLSPGDLVVDGGNSWYRDDRARADRLWNKGIRYLDAGVSGGVWGLEEGYCLMVGGDASAVEMVRPVLDALAPPGGHLHCGGTGAGHFVKMVHNGIEYAMLQAYGEGFELLRASPFGAGLDLADLSRVWNRGSVIRSWLLELAERALSEDPTLEDVRGFVEDSGEGRWTVRQAVETGVPAPAITLALFQRFRSRLPESFADKVIAALRREFGGHAVRKRGEEPDA